MIKRFASYYKPHLRLFCIDMLCALVVAVCNMFYPLIAKNIINDYVPNREMQLLITWSIALIGIYILKAVMNYIVTYWGHLVGVRIQADMRREMFAHIETLPLSFFDENKTGVIMSRMINDLQEISELAHHGPEDIFLSLLMMLGSMIILGRINLPLTLIVFTAVPVTVLFSAKLRSRMQKAFMQTREKTGEINANVETAISGVRVSRAYTASEHEISKFDNSNKAYISARSFAYKVMAEFHTGTSFFLDLMYAVVLFAGGLFFFNGKIDVGEFTAFLLYIANFFTPVRTLITMVEQLQNGITGFKRFTAIMDSEAEKERPDAVEAGRLKGDIAFENVSFRYQNSDVKGEEKVISNLDLSVPAGETLALVGPSGGGKTTLCNLIPRFYDVDSGRITVDGRDIRDFTRLSLRKNIGIVAQDVFLFDGTIKDNIRYGNLDATDEQVVEAAKKAHIHDHIMTLEKGYDTEVGERGIKLSGGQKQRISIARVFLKDPSILILDEATSALDNQTEMLIQQSLMELAKGRTCIIVAHRLSTIKNATEIVVLTPNGIEERGTHDSLMEKNGIYAELYSYQFRKE